MSGLVREPLDEQTNRRPAQEAGAGAAAARRPGCPGTGALTLEAGPEAAQAPRSPPAPPSVSAGLLLAPRPRTPSRLDRSAGFCFVPLY